MLSTNVGVPFIVKLPLTLSDQKVDFSGGLWLFTVTIIYLFIQLIGRNPRRLHAICVDRNYVRLHK